MTLSVLPHKVLFVDDDRSVRVAFANAARALGVEATLAESGGQALELAQSDQFPVVVTDLRMPGIDGMALIERMAALDAEAAFVLVSADSAPQATLPRRGGSAIAAFLPKPLQVGDLQDALARAYALHQRRKAQAEASDATGHWSLLVLEDNPGDATLIQEYLEGQGVNATYATRLCDALQLVHDREFDAILTDLTLPDARGFDAVLRLQASAPTAALLAYSGVADEALALQVVQLGAQDYLDKGGIDQAVLLRALRFARERKRSELRLLKLAHFDQLTGLANRTSFLDALEQAIARARRQDRRLAVLMIDLDGFKAINDSAGHEAGDQVLHEVGVRLRCVFREYDIVARLGGDEFAVLLPDVETTHIVTDVAARLLESLVEPIGPGGHRVGASIGVAIYPSAGRSGARLLRSADMAMYRAKRNGKNRCVFFDGPVPLTSNPRIDAVEELPSGSQLIAPAVPLDILEEPQSQVAPLRRSDRAL
jgi:two-component system cell cycle response regulator